MFMRLHIAKVGIPLAMALLLAGCEGCTDTSTQQNLSKAVWIKYVHLANVRRFQPNNGNSLQYSGANNNSFWAVFEICSIDVAGSALSGFKYDTGKFVITVGSDEISKATPGQVARSDATGLPSPGAQIDSAVHAGLETEPITEFLPKQKYVKPGYRFAIFLNNRPAAYEGGPMELHYQGQPDAAVVVQNALPEQRPKEVEFFNKGVSAEIVSTCP
jgi:hypothetical protein